MKYKAICFDLDGTLYPQDCLLKKTWRLAVKHPVVSLRYRRVRDELRRIQDNGDEFFDSLPFNDKEAIVYNRVNKSKGSTEKAREYLDRKYYSKLEKAYGNLPFQADVVKTFERIRRAGLKTGVFSDWPLFDKLEKIGVYDLCDFRESSVTDGYLKPSVHAFDKLLYNMNLSGTEVLYVGDSYSKDVLGAAKIGMDAVLINGKCSKDVSSYPAAVAVVKNWTEFDKWLSSVLEEN